MILIYENIDSWVGNNSKKTYYGKFKKAVGSIRAAQFLQFERYVDTSIDAELDANMPLVGEM